MTAPRLTFASLALLGLLTPLASAAPPDVDPPLLDATHPTAGACVADVGTASVTFSDAESGIDAASFTATLNGVDVSSSFTPVAGGASAPFSALPLNVGPNQLDLSVADLASNVATLSLSFVQDLTPPGVSVSSPVAIAHPGEPSPLDAHRFSPDPQRSDLPIPLNWSAHDADGIAGDLAAEELLLDGLPLDLTTWRAEMAYPDESAYPGGHAFWLPELPGGPTFVWAEGVPHFQEFADGRALLRGVVTSTSNWSRMWRVELWLTGCPAPSGGHLEELYPYNYAPGGPIAPASWRYYQLDPQAGASFVGMGLHDGESLSLAHEPADGSAAFQVGTGANGRDLAVGLSGNIAYSGSYSSSLATVNVTLQPASELTVGTFLGLDLPLLGAHTLELRASDEAGNQSSVTSPFEIVLESKWGLLFIDESTTTPGNTEIYASSFVPVELSTGAFAQTYADIDPAGLVLDGLDTQRSATPNLSWLEPASQQRMMRFVRAELEGPDGSLGERFRLSGRFAAGPGLPEAAFVGEYTLPDQDPPVLSFDAPAANGVLGPASTIRVSYQDALAVDLSSLVIRWDGVDVTAAFTVHSDAATAPLAALDPALTGEGAHTLSVDVEDLYDNAAQGSISCQVDRTGPTITLDPAEGGLRAFPGPADIGIVYSDTLAGVALGSLEATIDGAPLALVVEPTRATAALPSLGDGSHTLAVNLADLAGNSSSATATFTVETASELLLSVSAPGDLSAGSTYDLEIEARLASGLRASGYTGVVVLQDGQAGSPLDGLVVPLAQGAATLPGVVQLTRSGVHPLGATSLDGELTGSLDLTVLPGPAATLDASPGDVSIPSGRPVPTLTALVRDTYGNGVPGASLRLLVDAVEAAQGSSDAEGRFAVDLGLLSVGQHPAAFELSGLPDAGFVIDVVAPATEDLWLNVLQAPGAPGPNGLGQGEQPTDLVLRLTEQDVTGAPRDGVSVEARVFNPQGEEIGLRRGLTDAAGETSIVLPRLYAVGTHSVRVNVPGQGQLAVLTVDVVSRQFVAGRIIDADLAPLPGVAVSVAGTGLSGTSDATGFFRIEQVPSGAQILELDAAPAGTRVQLGLRVEVGGAPLVLARPLVLPRLTASDFQTLALDGNGQTPAATSLELSPGVRFELAAGAHASFPAGHAAELAARPLELAALPWTLPAGYQAMSPPVKVEPSGASFPDGADLRLPNTTGAAAGTSVELFRAGLDTGRFEAIGTAAVSSDGLSLVSVGAPVDHLSCFLAAAPAPSLTTVVGRVLDDAGQPLPGATISLLGSATTTRADDPATSEDEAGSFALVDIPLLGSEPLVVLASSVNANGYLESARSLPAPPVSGGTTDVGTFRIGAQTAISGRLVRDVGGSPVPVAGALAQALGYGATSAADGTFTILGVPSAAAPVKVFGTFIDSSNPAVTERGCLNAAALPPHGAIDVGDVTLAALTNPFTNGQAPALVLGAPHPYYGRNSDHGGTGHLTDASAVHACTCGRVFAAVRDRVLVWDEVPADSLDPADLVLGAPDFDTSSSWRPQAVFTDHQRLFVAERHRVLIWNDVANLSNGQAPDVVLGQADLSEAPQANRGGAAGADTLAGPRGVHVAGGVLVVADTQNRRVLGWNQIPTSNGQPADWVVGQPDFGSTDPNYNGVSAESLCCPADVRIVGSSLYVADEGANRVLVFSPLPASSNPSASAVLGQSAFTSSAAADLPAPADLAGEGSILLVTSGEQVAIFDTLPGTTGRLADRYYAASQFSLVGAALSANRLFVADADRGLLIFDRADQVNGSPAPDRVIHPRGTVGAIVHPDASTLPAPRSVVPLAGGDLVVLDAERYLLRFDAPQQANVLPGLDLHEATASNFSWWQTLGGDANRLYVAESERIGVYDLPLGPASTPSFHLPETQVTGISLNAGRLFAAQREMHRVAIYGALPTSAQALPLGYLGQGALGGANAQGLSASSMNWANDVALSGNDVLVADAGNRRLLVFRDAASLGGTANPAAQLVLGQPDFHTVDTTQDGLQDLAHFHRDFVWHGRVAAHGGRLYAADRFRLLFWNRIPTTPCEPADGYIPLGNFGQRGDIVVDDDHLWIAHPWERQVLRFDFQPLDTPRITALETPAAPYTEGLIPVEFSVSDPQGDPISVAASYSTDGGQSYQSATLIGTTTNLSSGGYTLEWDAGVLGPVRAEQVRLRLIPSDAAVGTGSETFDFLIDQSPLRVTGVFLTAGEISQGSTGVQVTVDVRNSSTQTTTLSGVTLQFQDAAGNDLSAQVSAYPLAGNPSSVGAGQLVQLSFLVDVAAGATLQDVHIVASAAGTDGGGAAVQADSELPASFTVVPPAGPVSGPSIALSSSQLNMGTPTLRSDTHQALTVTNAGDAPLTISALDLSGDAAFGLLGAPGLPWTLGPGASGDLLVRFHQLQAGSVAGTLTLTSDDPATPQALVLLVGGADPVGLDPGARFWIEPRLEEAGETIELPTNNYRSLLARYVHPGICDRFVSDQTSWVSSDPSVASVDATGRVLGVADGVTTITASYARNGTVYGAQRRIRVVPRTLQFDPPLITTYPGMPQRLELYRFRPQVGCATPVAASQLDCLHFSDPGANVSFSNGNVSIGRAGTHTLTACLDGQQAVATIRVLPYPGAAVDAFDGYSAAPAASGSTSMVVHVSGYYDVLQEVTVTYNLPFWPQNLQAQSPTGSGSGVAGGLSPSGPCNWFDPHGRQTCIGNREVLRSQWVSAGTYTVSASGSTGYISITGQPNPAGMIRVRYSTQLYAAGTAPNVPPVVPPSFVSELPEPNDEDELEVNDGDEDSPASPSHPCNIYLRSGEEHLERTDLQVPGRGKIHFAFTRRYRSQITYDGPLGHNWDFTYNEKVAPAGDGSGDLLRQNGRGRTTRWVPCVGGNGIEYRAPGYAAVITRDEAENYVLRESDGFLRVYRADGRLARHQDAQGNHMQFHYDSLGNLEYVLDALDRRYDFFWELRGGEHRLRRLRDFTGREVMFTYDAADDLVQVRSPVVSGTITQNDFPNGRTEAYTYYQGGGELAHNIRTLTLPQEFAAGGDRAFEWFYDADDRVERRIRGGTTAGGVSAGGEITLQYLTLSPETVGDCHTIVRRTVVTDRNGNVSHYDFDTRGFNVRTRRLTRGLRAGEPAYFETQNFYDDEGRLIRRIEPRGNETRWLYQDQLQRASRFALHNVLEVWELPVGGGEALVTRQTYEPVFQQLATIVEPRGTSPGYLPPEGVAGPGRYETRFFYDYQEGGLLPQPWWVSLEEWLALPRGLGDLNDDGRLDQLAGNTVLSEAPAVQLAVDSQEAIRLGSLVQDIRTQQQWNDAGRLVATIDPEGYVTERTYYPGADPAGSLGPNTGSPNGSGYLASVVQDARLSPRRLSSSPVLALETAYQYDSLGNPIWVRDPRGVVSTSLFNQLSEVVQVTRGVDLSQAIIRGELPAGTTPLGYRTRFVYDHTGRVIATEAENRDGNTPGVGDWIVTNHVYDLFGNPVQKTVELDAQSNLVWTWEYDPGERPHIVTRPGGDRTRIIYDERDLPFLVTRGLGTAEESTTRIDYDANGNRALSHDAEDHDGDGLPETTTYVYDGYDRLTQVVDALGNRSVTSYDVAGNVVATQRFGHPANDPAGAEVLFEDERFVHDELNRVVRSEARVFLPTGFAPQRPVVHHDADGDGWTTTRYEFDALSRPTHTIEDDGELSLKVYDGANRVIETRDALGNRTLVEFDRGSNPARVETVETAAGLGLPNRSLVTLHVHDQLGRLVRATDDLGRTTRFAYDSRDLLVLRSDPQGALTADPLGLFSGQINAPGNTVAFHHDGMGRVTDEVKDLRLNGQGDQPLDLSNPHNPDGQVTLHYDYDGNSRLLGITDDAGSTTSMLYDALDRLVLRQLADGSQFVFGYDRDSNLRTVQQPTGTVVVRTPDALNRLVQVDVQRGPGVAGTLRETYAYDGLSRVTRATDDNGLASALETTEWVYDSLGRELEERQNGRVLSGTWRGDGVRTALTLPGGRQLSYAYDAVDRIVGISEGASSVAGFDWAGSGYRPLRRQNGNGSELSFLDDTGTLDSGYDPVNQVVRLRWRGPTGGAWVDRSYTYNRAGLRLTQTRTDDAGLTDLLEYDSLYRVTRAEIDQLGGTGATPRDLSARSFVFDGVGNRRAWTDELRSGSPVTHSTSVNALNEYTAIDAVTRTHDDAGNLRENAAFAFAYDYRQRLVSVVQRVTSVPVAWYRYDAEGRRVGKVVYDPAAPGQVLDERVFAYDDGRLVEERNGAGTTLATYVHDPSYEDALVQVQHTAAHPRGAETLYPHQDARYDVVAISNDNPLGAELIETVRYDDAGLPEHRDAGGTLLSPSQSAIPFGFQGRYHDVETGLYQFRARMYDPATGRFLQRDPVWDAVNLGNQYSFVGNSPYSRLDPTGTVTRAHDEIKTWADGVYKKAWGATDSKYAKGALCIGRGLITGLYEAIASIGRAAGNVWNLVDAAADAELQRELAARQNVVEFAHTLEAGRDRMSRSAAQAAQVVSTFGPMVLPGAGGLRGAGMRRVARFGRGAGSVARRGRSGRARVHGTHAAVVRAKPKRGACFLAGTRVETPEGRKAIENLRVGDEVLSRDEVTGRQGIKRVARLFRGHTSRVVTLRIAEAPPAAQRGRSERHRVGDPGGEEGEDSDSDPGASAEQELRCTLEHPFWVEGRGWVAAGGLRVGDALRGSLGERLLLTGHAIAWEEADHYNVEVEDWHTYFVSQTEQGPAVWVHNTCLDDINLYRSVHPGLRPLTSTRPLTRGDGMGTVAFVQVGGRKFFGAKPSGSSLPDARALASRFFNEVLRPGGYYSTKHWNRVGGVANLVHAESVALMRAWRRLGTGNLPKHLELVLDRATCAPCRPVLQNMIHALGVERLTIRSVLSGVDDLVIDAAR